MKTSVQKDPAILLQEARTIAEQIRAGSVDLHEGSRRIWWECQLYLPAGDHRLDPFTYWASEYEDAEDEERKTLCERGMSVAVSQLLDDANALQ